jgi:tetratricopeptide (TPR) repeat protein
LWIVHARHYSFKKREYEQAISVFKKVIELNPNSYEAWGEIALALCKLGRYREVIDAYKKGIEAIDRRLAICKLQERYAEIARAILANDGKNRRRDYIAIKKPSDDAPKDTSRSIDK